MVAVVLPRRDWRRGMQLQRDDEVNDYGGGPMMAAKDN